MLKFIEQTEQPHSGQADLSSVSNPTHFAANRYNAFATRGIELYDPVMYPYKTNNVL